MNLKSKIITFFLGSNEDRAKKFVKEAAKLREDAKTCRRAGSLWSDRGMMIEACNCWDRIDRLDYEADCKIGEANKLYPPPRSKVFVEVIEEGKWSPRCNDEVSFPSQSSEVYGHGYTKGVIIDLPYCGGPALVRAHALPLELAPLFIVPRRDLRPNK